MEEDTDNISFKLLANPIKLKRKYIGESITEDDILFIKIKKRYIDMLILNSDKNEILNKLESILVNITISNIIDNIVKEIEYESLP